MVWTNVIDRAVNEAVNSEVEAAYVAGYREAAALYCQKLEITQQAYSEAPMKAEAYRIERAKDEVAWSRI